MQNDIPMDMMKMNANIPKTFLNILGIFGKFQTMFYEKITMKRTLQIQHGGEKFIFVLATNEK